MIKHKFYNIKRKGGKSFKSVLYTKDLKSLILEIFN